jgi:hypothetical protein
MQGLFPNTSFLAEQKNSQREPAQWIMPSARRCNRFGIYKMPPNGQPDCIHVDIIHTREGTERCTAVIYEGKAYVIHYTFKKYDV